jgi:hypothetical protein
MAAAGAERSLQTGDRVVLLVDVLPGQQGETGTVTEVFAGQLVTVLLDPQFGAFLIGPAPMSSFALAG